MSIKVIEKRLLSYKTSSGLEEMNALKEIIQEIALGSLARSHFFNNAAFQGGSCLRIVHQLNRFSEDLDFMLINPDTTFVWEPFLHALQEEFMMYNLEFQVIDRSKAEKAVKLAFLKDNSFGKVLVFTHPRSPSDEQSILIKFEIDTNPPAGSLFESQYLDFPYTFSIMTQDLPSLFASKCHALLCRPYTKGRDWYDFAWYISKKVAPNFGHLSYALDQSGPWQNQHISVTGKWLVESLKVKINTIDWEVAKGDIKGFLKPHDQEALKVWGSDFFFAMAGKLSQYLAKE